ncbi:hypothetical protein ABPG77_000469 [Micractinium sp. CCAP 211/92]
MDQCASGGRIGPAVSTKDMLAGDTSADPIWQAFSHDQGTLYLGPELLGSTTTDSDVACATQCSTTPGCSWWSFCPPDGFAYCELLHYCNATAGDASSEYLPTGTCLLSGLGAGANTSVLVTNNVMTGGSVGWVGGYVKTDANSSTGSRRRRKLAAATPGAERAAARAARATRALQQDSSGADDVWRSLTSTPHSYYRASNLTASGATASDLECASACAQSIQKFGLECHFWTWCPADQTDGCQAYDFCGGPPTLDPQHTLTWSDGRLAYTTAVGSSVGRRGGLLNVIALQQAQQQQPGSTPNLSPAPGSENCAAGQMICGGGCIDVENDAMNCGYCSRMCDAGESCSSGVCSCGSGLTSCGGTCVDTLSDSSHCGSCAYACSDGQSCSYGSCS